MRKNNRNSGIFSSTFVATVFGAVRRLSFTFPRVLDIVSPEVPHGRGQKFIEVYTL
jgi:hypothetical protein